MFNFLSRRARRPSTGQKSANVLPLSQLDATEELKTSSIPLLNIADVSIEQRKGSSPERPLTSEPYDEEQASSQPLPEPFVASTPNPHDSTISEIKAGLRQVDVLTGATPRPEQTSDRRPSPAGFSEPLYDPATGEQRGTFSSFHSTSVPATDTSNAPSDHTATKLANDEVWSHLARIRELQSDIARMHVHMEGIGDTRHVLDIDVDADIDVDSVPTQEEEEAVKRQKAFDKLPRKFTGRSEGIDAIMSKLDELSHAVTAFHALQPPPLNFENSPISDDTIDDNLPSLLSSRMMSVSTRGRQLSFPASVRTVGTGVGSRNPFSSAAMHESPVSLQDNFIDPPNH